MTIEELKKWYWQLIQCPYCKLTIWQEDSSEIVYYNGEFSHVYCLEQVKNNRIKELLAN